jgi:hypothetical protein
MRSNVPRWIAAIVVATGIAAQASRLAAFETTYGEDPVPSTVYYKGYINLGYGIDPIPAKSLSQRWQEWRASRGLGPELRIFHRTSGAAARPAVDKSDDARAGEGRAATLRGTQRIR